MAEPRFAPLEAHQLSYRVTAGRFLIDDVSLTLNPGELVALIGPNGAGKSTLLRLLTGYLTPQRGECRLDGRALTSWSPGALSRLRAVMRQDNTLTASFLVEEVVAMGRAPWRDTPEPDVVSAVLALTGCEHLRRRLYPQLSGGEQQRVRLAQALAQLWRGHGPQGWLFLDEPTSALDLFYQQRLLRLLKSLTIKGNIAVCCVLHDLNLASLWADRVVVMQGGCKVAEGAPAQVLTETAIQRWYQAEVWVSRHLDAGTPQVALRR
ncbi:heme ABC transporter ATP-binding protein [Dickeya poaceiphila]|uniref:Heme ABC transporter ATP-binding protein n=1 Tax=Dickeya poaceiphila TaxID=568768 RepID=A0A5B8IA21_9GAMM|nr:heme ABC transporter ATP-binding protein [Dickeya poaceiphila]QDX30568.1 heme ABC transporter ATP-binding protein [Dickeya poaceiphila]